MTFMSSGPSTLSEAYFLKKIYTRDPRAVRVGVACKDLDRPTVRDRFEARTFFFSDLVWNQRTVIGPVTPASAPGQTFRTPTAFLLRRRAESIFVPPFVR